jgi:hypothetical protein
LTQVQRLQRLQQTVEKLVEQDNKPVWVKVSFVKEKTGWSNEKMRQARNLALIEWRKDEVHGFLYNIKSLDPIFIKK